MADVIRVIETHRRNGDRSAPQSEVARELGVSISAIERWRKRGLPSFKVGLVVHLEWNDLWTFLRPAPEPPKRGNSSRARRFLASRGM